MTSFLVLMCACITIGCYSMMVSVIQRMIAEKSGFPVAAAALRSINRGRFLAVLLVGMMTCVAWLFLIDRQRGLSFVQTAFFIQGVLFASFYVHIVAEEFVIGDYPGLPRDEQMFYVILASAFSLMAIDFCVTLIMALIGLGYFFIYG